MNGFMAGRWTCRLDGNDRLTLVDEAKSEVTDGLMVEDCSLVVVETVPVDDALASVD